MDQKPDFVMTVLELRTVQKILEVLVMNRTLPQRQTEIAKGIIEKMRKCNTGEFN